MDKHVIGENIAARIEEWAAQEKDAPVRHQAVQWSYQGRLEGGIGGVGGAVNAAAFGADFGIGALKICWYIR